MPLLLLQYQQQTKAVCDWRKEWITTREHAVGILPFAWVKVFAEDSLEELWRMLFFVYEPDSSENTLEVEPYGATAEIERGGGSSI